ncbi:glycoside hydrolase family 2 protein [Alicyclobacillus fastidiosus]|uniref:Glycoside hydrolase family 2 TIM barrel-domain containing protein n=1 Tax=Alicyclobacillus fastidiosus TaxID=392011 RepID=A0ABV5ABW0_9BACL|nr:sugar-binding domain-containing protein [Alicyclobacillus fastidiosus]WEH10281.1 glycoside hydrolase family 2 TIM barrel-domain containing protein [Alicyclobacillus fastidiosus]
MSTLPAVKKIRDEYPRPQFARDFWVNLNGEWNFRFDDEDVGVREQWYNRESAWFTDSILVPFCFQSELSGIHDIAFHDIVWYQRTFDIADAFHGKRVMLHFGAIDYESTVWVNGCLVTVHEGGHVPFSVDVTDVLKPVGNVVVVRVYDPSDDIALPRGKQYWLEKSESIFYTRTTGIWQTVWMEAVHETHLQRVRFTPDIDREAISIEAQVSQLPAASTVQLQVEIWFQGQPLKREVMDCTSRMEIRTIHLGTTTQRLNQGWLWSPEHPNLFDVRFTLMLDGVECDVVKSYFGMRKIAVEDGAVYLNNFPYKMKLVLDQGYFPTGILTAPSDDDLRRDVELVKQMGFNGVRKHQKVEDPRFLYWCDKLGLLVWGEMANAYAYSHEYVRKLTSEWQAVIERDYNHPSIVAWVPLNESWGVPNIRWNEEQRHHALAMYHLTRSLDATRLVISNDGWEHVKSDLCTIHDYEWRRDVLCQRYQDEASAIAAMPGHRKIYVGGATYDGAPILVTEFGGIAYKKSDWEGWGYSGATTDEDYLARLRDVVHPLLTSPIVQGYCYTQFTDVEQEINGLLTYDRVPKVPLEEIRKINEGL